MRIWLSDIPRPGPQRLVDAVSLARIGPIQKPSWMKHTRLRDFCYIQWLFALWQFDEVWFSGNLFNSDLDPDSSEAIEL